MAEETNIDDEVVVHIDAETEKPPAEGDVKVTTEDPVAEAKAQFAKLEQERDAERARREQAEHIARAAHQTAESARREAESARSEIADSQLGGVSAGIAAAEAEATAAEQAYAAAMEAGNFAEAAKAQRRMSRAEAEGLRLTEAKNDIEARKVERRIEADTRPQPQPQQIDDPVERLARQSTQRTADWIRAHPDWIRDQKKAAKLTAAHWNAVAEGITQDSDAYFDYVETSVGLRSSDGVVPVKAHTRRVSPPVAPVASGNSGASQGGQEVRLSKKEAEAATDGTHIWNYEDPTGQRRWKKGDPIGIQEFARRKAAMIKQGQYDRSYTEQ
jgi:hypothetical protein